MELESLFEALDSRASVAAVKVENSALAESEDWLSAHKPQPARCAQSAFFQHHNGHLLPGKGGSD